jgi:hypothetical protein
MKTDGVFGGRITQALIQGLSLRARWSRSRKVPCLAFLLLYAQTQRHLHLLRRIRTVTHGLHSIRKSL